MGTRLTITGADFSGVAVAFAAPVAAGLEYWNYFGGTAGKTGLNLAAGKPKPSVVGSPGVSSNFATFLGGANYLVTGLADQAEVTMLAVGRPNPAGDSKFRYLIGSFNGGGIPAGSNLYFQNDAVGRPVVGAARNASGTDTLQANSISAETDVSAFAFYAARMGAAYNRLDDKTRGLSNAGAITNPRSTPNGQTYRIGSSVGVVTPVGALDLAWAAIYSRCLTDAEISTIYANVQAYLANSRGLTV